MLRRVRDTPSPPDRAVPAQRRQDITRYVATNGHATVAELSRLAGVSQDTIRRDLSDLSSEGIIVRTYGGVVKAGPDSNIHHLTFQARTQENLGAKQAIGVAAAGLISDGTTLLVNGGTTVIEFARALIAKRRLTLITNNLMLPSVLPEGAVNEVHILGGQYDPTSLVTLGPVHLPNHYGAEPHLLYADYAVLGTGGIAVNPGFSGTDVRESSMIRAMMDRAATVIILADSSKFNRQALATIADLGLADYVVTESSPDSSLSEALAGASVRLVVAREAINASTVHA